MVSDKKMNRLRFADENSIELRDVAPGLYPVYIRLTTSRRYEAVIDRKVRTRCDECLETFQVGDERVLVSSVVENKKKRKQRYHKQCLNLKIKEMKSKLQLCGYRV